MTARVVLGLLLAVALVTPGTAVADRRGGSPRNITIRSDGIHHQTGHLDPLKPEMHVSQPGGIALVRVGG